MVDANETPLPVEGEQSTPEADSPESSASVRRESISASNISDQATELDRLGFAPYVEAIAAFLSNEATQPPLTLSIEGEWGSGKSSFMRQLHEELEQIEQRDGKPISRKVWFNAWRHDKVEALWAAFALDFLNQISQPRTRSEILPTWMSYLGLLRKRFNWKENWLDAIRGTALVAFFGSFAVALPVLFLNVGWDGINQLSDEIVCRLMLPEEEDQVDAEQGQNAGGQEQEQKQNSCFELNPGSGNGSDTVLSVLLWLGGFGGSTTGTLALLVQLKKMLGDPKNDLKQYIEHPNYKNQVAFIEQFHKDFEKVVSAYVGEGNKVYVFIDDLDRCELTKAADLMQGLNLLISNDPHLIFILGMDREKVAAGIALKQKDVLPYLSSPSVVLNQAAKKDQTSLKGLEYGYAYIEKFVQLPFQVPKASEANFSGFLKTLPYKPIGTTPPTKRKLSSLPRSNWFFSSLVSRLIYLRAKELGRRLFSAEKASVMLAAIYSKSTSASNLIREPRVEIRLAQDSEAIQQIILKVAPALDYNPRRIKQFINLFRLKVFIAYNTGLFDQLNHGENEENDSNASEAVSQPLTLEQLGKFTALCMQYPLLRIDLEDNNALLANLQRYALNPSWPNSKSEEEAHSADTAKHEGYDNTTKYWGSNPKLIQLLRIGLHMHETRQRQDAKQNGDSLELESSNSKNYNLEKIDVKKLLQVSSTVKPIDRVPLRSERGVDYRQLRELLRAKLWRKADGETGRIMLKATKRNGLGYFDPLEIEKFSCQDLRTIDQLWVVASGGQFGFSVQKELYVKCGGILDGEHHEEAWNLFCEKNGWQESGKYVPVRYGMKSPVAHLPSQGRRGGFRKTARQEGTGFPSLALKLAKCEITGEF